MACRTRASGGGGSNPQLFIRTTNGPQCKTRLWDIMYLRCVHFRNWFTDRWKQVPSDRLHVGQICGPRTIALCPALLAASTLQPCRNAILLLSVSPWALLLPLDFNPVETQFFYSQLKEEHTSVWRALSIVPSSVCSAIVAGCSKLIASSLSSTSSFGSLGRL